MSQIPASSPFFNTVQLQTRSGEFVGKVRVQAFFPPAEVLMWGERIFTLHKAGEERHSEHVYREGMLAIARLDLVG